MQFVTPLLLDLAFKCIVVKMKDLSVLICGCICIITEKPTEKCKLDDSTSALFCLFSAQHIMPKYQCTKAKQKLHNVLTNLEISFASVIDVDVDVP